MMPALQLPLAQLNALFSIVMVMDRNLRVVFSSDTLQQHLPAVSQAPLFNELFDVKRPRSFECFEDTLPLLDSLFLLETKDRSFAVRGQMLHAIDDDGIEYLCLFGSPWLSWVITNNPELNLGIRDFSHQDVQLDQLFYISTEKRMVEDLERLNEQLQSAKEEVESAQAAKNAFFAQMSHEMRTPLNSVVSALTLIQDEDLTEKAGQLVQLARGSSSNLMQVINYVLDLSKIESTDDRVEEIEFDLPELIASVIDIVQARAMEKGLQLNSHIDSSLESIYRGDHNRLRQALLNLVFNAIKFTNRGSITIEVARPQTTAQQLRFAVVDTGIGIEEQDLERIFEPFRTLEERNVSCAESSTGLGLDIARRNIELMGGKIGVSSTPGVGSTFWAELPCQAVTTPKNTETSAVTQASASVSTNEEKPCFTGEVLLVDDNETNLMLGTMILEKMGINVTPALSGEEAVDIARRADLDLVLMDINMPGIDGFEATRQIRVFHSSAKLPIVALSAFTSSLERTKSQESGMDDYLTKPMEPQKLEETLAKWLPRAQQNKAASSNEGAANSQASAVDREVLQQLKKQIGMDNALTVIDKFCSEAEIRWDALANASSAIDIAREAHTLASTCRSFGLPELADKLNLIEAYARSPDATAPPPDIAPTGAQLVEDLVALRAAIEGM